MPLPSRDSVPPGTTDFFFRTLVPLDPWKNVAYRRWVFDKCWADPEFAEEQWIICSRDLLYYVAVFGWLLEPRDKAPWQPGRHFGKAREIPFLPREYQCEDMLRMLSHLGTKDMLALKSREVGATWMVLYLFDWSWRFHSQMHYGVMSKDEDSADNPNNPDSLLAKMDFIDEHLPAFLRPRRMRNKSDHSITNLDNGSTIIAWACTGSVGTGGRKRAVFCDEAHFFPVGSDYASFFSLQHVTHCRIAVSTPNPERGQQGAFFDAWENKDSEVERFEIHWARDKEKSAGSYHADGNNIEFLDPTYTYKPGYKFIRDGKTRSPYYDYECARPMATEQSVAAELDMDFGGATTKFFDPHIIFKARQECRAPTGYGMLRKVEGYWLPEIMLTDKEQPIELWMDPISGLRFAENGRLLVPEGRQYSMGVDVAYGLGGTHASVSAISIMDKMTSTQVCEFATGKMPPEDFAEFCAFVGKAFNTALLCVEATGVGKFFVGKIVNMQYPNLWKRTSSLDDIWQRDTRKVGFDNKDAGALLLGELKQAMQRGTYHPRSRRAVDECNRYHINSNGDLKHPLVGRGRADAPEKSHGDCAIAMAASWYAVHTEEAYREPDKKPDEFPEGSFGWRRQEFDKGREASTACSSWDPDYKYEARY